MPLCPGAANRIVEFALVPGGSGLVAFVGFALVSYAQGIFPGPKLADIGEGAAEVFVVGSEDLGGTAAMGLVALGIFDRVHEGEGLPTIGEGDAEVPAFKEATIAAIPVVAAVGCLEGVRGFGIGHRAIIGRSLFLNLFSQFRMGEAGYDHCQSILGIGMTYTNEGQIQSTLNEHSQTLVRHENRIVTHEEALRRHDTLMNDIAQNLAQVTQNLALVTVAQVEAQREMAEIRAKADLNQDQIALGSDCESDGEYCCPPPMPVSRS